MAAPMWTEHQTRPVEDDDAVSPFVKHLAVIGVLEEAERIWEAEDAGANPCDATPLSDFLDEAKRRNAG